MSRKSKSLKTMNNLLFQGAIIVLFNHTVFLLAFQWICGHCAHWLSLEKWWKFSYMRVIYGIIAGKRSILIFNTSWMSYLAMKQRWLLLPLNKFYEEIAVFTQKTQAKHLPAWSSFRSWISISEMPPLRSLSKSRQYREHKIPWFHQYCQLAGLDFLSSPPFGVTAILRHLSSLRNDRKSALCIPVLQPSFWIAAGRNFCTECHNA